jgi:hypothetical protein
MSAYLQNPALLSLPFDQYGRYQLMRDALDAARPVVGSGEARRLRVLDVGGFHRTGRGTEVLPGQMFLHADAVTVVDQPPCALPGYLQGDGRSLTFEDGAFDFVISCDTLEHVPPADRPGFLRELGRVARQGVLLAAPFASAEVVAAEALLFSYIQAELGVEQIQLKEHADYGLPNLDTVCALLDEHGMPHRVYPSGYVHAWLFMMVAKHYLLARTGFHSHHDLHEQVDAYYTRFFAAHERCEPSYRHALCIAHQQHTAWLDAVDAAIAPTIYAPHHADSRWPELAGWLFQLTGLSLNDKALQPLRQAVAAQEDTIRQQQQLVLSLQATLRERDAHIADLQQRATWLAAQAHDAQQALAAVEQGTLMRLLRWWQQWRMARKGQ